jgi:hypothetical protein
MQRCHVPVLAIPDGCKFVGLNSIAFASDYLTYYNEADLEPMINMAMHHNAKIDVVHMLQQEHLSEDQENNRAFLDSIISNVTHEFVTLEQQDIFEVIQKYIEDNNIKMLAMMSKKYSFLERLFSQHNVEVFGFKINVPFLVMENTGQKS